MTAPSLKVLSSMATRELLAELTAAYARSRGRAAHAEAAGGVDVVKRIQSGEAVDVVVLASTAIEKLLTEGKLLPGTRIDLARSGVAVAVRAGAAHPDISSEAAVRAAVLAAGSLGYSTGPSGVHLEKTFERWGILAQIRPRIVVAPPGVPVGSLVAGGKVELGFQQLSELISLAGIEVVGPLPSPVQTLTTFAGAVACTSRAPEAARELLAYLASPASASLKQRYGMEAL